MPKQNTSFMANEYTRRQLEIIKRTTGMNTSETINRAISLLFDQLEEEVKRIKKLENQLHLGD